MESAGVRTGKQELLVAFSLIYSVYPEALLHSWIVKKKKDTEMCEIFCFVDFKRQQYLYT